MAYCTQCGTEVAETARFCPGCGAAQAASATTEFLKDMPPRTASVLCYIPFLGWIAAIVVLASQRFREDRQVRFHAFQGLYLFVAWLLVDQVIKPWFGYWPGAARFPGHLLQMAILAAWIVMIIKTSRSEFYSLPIFGDLADKSVSEQK